MNLEELSERFGRSKRTIMRWVANGQFPKPTIREGKLVTWNEDAVRRWCKRHRRRIGSVVRYVLDPIRKRSRAGVGRAARDARRKAAQPG